MKKLIFVCMLLAAMILPISAQTSQMATLLHNGEMSIYYGANGLKDAYAVAEDGDVITLSSGLFAAVNIGKGIVIRGAGMNSGSVKETASPTNIAGTFSVSANKKDDMTVLEGIHFSDKVTINVANNLQLIKCSFENIEANVSGADRFKNFQMLNCIVSEKFSVFLQGVLSGDAFDASLVAINCVLPVSIDANGLSSGHLYATYNNCIIPNARISGGKDSSNYNGCIINVTDKFSKGCIVSNCVIYGNEDPFELISQGNNISNTLMLGKDIFKEGTFYEPIDEVKALTTSDGTEPGIYGGNMPFDPTTTVPQINKFSVSPRTSADGKLSVDIEVEAIKQ